LLLLRWPFSQRCSRQCISTRSKCLHERECVCDCCVQGCSTGRKGEVRTSAVLFLQPVLRFWPSASLCVFNLLFSIVFCSRTWIHQAISFRPLYFACVLSTSLSTCLSISWLVCVRARVVASLHPLPPPPALSPNVFLKAVFSAIHFKQWPFTRCARLAQKTKPSYGAS
jgi:hypothetical protein